MTNIEIMKPKYMPVDLDYIDVINEEMKNDSCKIVFFTFSEEPELDDTEGKISRIEETKDSGAFLIFEDDDKVRLDRIVVINGKPGPAYDEYDAYALAPLTCKAGYDGSMC